MTAWDGSATEFWAAVMKTRAIEDIESDAAVLSEVLAIARLARRRQEALRAAANSWREAAKSVNQPDSPSIYVDCAETLEYLLRDPEPFL